MIISIFANFILLRLVSPEIFGIFALINVAIGISQWIINSGLGQYIIYSREIDDSDYSTLAIANYISGLLLFILYQVVVNSLSEILSLSEYEFEMRIVGIMILLSSVSISQRTRATKEMQFKKLALITIFGVIIANIVSIFVAELGRGLHALITKSLVQTGLIFVTQLYIFGPIKLKKFDLNRFREMYTFGLPLLGRGLLFEGYKKFLDYTISSTFGFEQLGWFNEGQKLPKTSGSIASKSINRVAFPMLSKMNAKDKGYTYVYDRFLLLTLVCSGFIGLFFVGFARELVRFYFGQEWIDSVHVIILLSVSVSIQVLVNYFYTIAKTEGLTKFSLINFTIRVVVHVLYLVITLPNFTELLLSLIIMDLAEFTILTGYLSFKRNNIYIRKILVLFVWIILLLQIANSVIYSTGMLIDNLLWWIGLFYISVAAVVTMHKVKSA